MPLVWTKTQYWISSQAQSLVPNLQNQALFIAPLILVITNCSLTNPEWQLDHDSIMRWVGWLPICRRFCVSANLSYKPPILLNSKDLANSFQTSLLAWGLFWQRFPKKVYSYRYPVNSLQNTILTTTNQHFPTKTYLDAKLLFLFTCILQQFTYIPCFREEIIWFLPMLFFFFFSPRERALKTPHYLSLIPA